MAEKIKYFCNGKGDIFLASNVENFRQEYKGNTVDGDAVYQVTFFDKYNCKYISYNTVVYQGQHEYIVGSGQESSRNCYIISRWNFGNFITWQKALRSRTRDLLLRDRR